MTPKLKYSDRHMPPVKETFFLTTPVTPVLKHSRAVQLGKKNYMSAEEDVSGESLIGQLLEAISRTEEWSFLRMLMNEHTPEGMAGGEVAAETPGATNPEKDYREKVNAYRRIGHDDAESLHYQLPREDDGAELCERRRKAHDDAAVAYGTFVESRREISDKAAEYATAHACGYTEALTAIGETLPLVPVLPSRVS